MKQETIKFKSIMSCVIGPETDDFFGFWNYSKCKVLVNVASP